MVSGAPQSSTIVVDGVSLPLNKTPPTPGAVVVGPERGARVVLTMPIWKALAARLEKMEVTFVIEPYIRFEGEVGEQATMFFLDPSGNAIEFKAFQDDNMIFKK